MKRILSTFLGASVWLLMPLAALAGTVTTTQDFTITLPSNGEQYTLKSESTFNSLDVSANAFTFTLDPKDQAIVISNLKRNLDNNRTATICNADDSRTIQAVATTGVQVVVTITPSGTCTVSTATATGGGGGGGGGGSGGGGTSASSSPAPSPSSSPSPSPIPTSTSTPSLTAAPTPSVTPPPSVLIAPQPITPSSVTVLTPPVIISRFISLGSQGDDVKDLQTFLATDISIYPEGIISGYFGPKTQAAIQRFQEKYGIARKGQPGYGIVGPQTRAKLKEVSSHLSLIPSQPTVISPPIVAIPSVTLSRLIGIGSQGDDVKDLQTFLATDISIYPEGIISGYFGPKTQAAIQRFQEKYGIARKGQPGYGIVGPQTRAKLKEVSSDTSGVMPIISPSPLPVVSPSSGVNIADLQAQIKMLQDRINQLKTR